MSTAEGPFRVYVLEESGAAKHIASCDDDSLGFCLLTLEDEGQLEDRWVGIMHRPDSDQTGNWIINPYQRKI